MRKITVVTGTRAEYGLFYPLLKKINTSPEFQLQIVVTGMHLSPEFGLTYRQIEADGFPINEKVEMLLSSDTEVGISKSVGIGIIGFADVFQRLQPELVLVLGDRFETFAAVVAAFIAKIPIAHLYGGDLTEGVIDDAIRHSITKMSHLHFVSTEEYRKRVIQLGESPERVFNVGALGIDNIKELKLLSKQELEKELNFTLGNQSILVTFHPVTLESNTTAYQFNQLLEAIKAIDGLKVIFTKPNADTNGRVLINQIENFVRENPDNAIAFTSLGQLRYLSAVRYVSAVVGNSSSGLIEVPSLGKPTVNIGDRQKGRIFAPSVLHCSPEQKAIVSTLEQALTPEFQSFCKNVTNPYGDGTAAEKIIKILHEKISTINMKKTFYNIEVKLSE